MSLDETITNNKFMTVHFIQPKLIVMNLMLMLAIVSSRLTVTKKTQPCVVINRQFNILSESNCRQVEIALV